MKNENKSESRLIIGVLVIFTFTLWGLNHGNIGKNEGEIDSINGKIEELESYSHYH